MPSVSVIVPTHNRAAYLHRTLQSVLAQTFTDYELIVVDDGSTDDTPSVVCALADTRIHFVQQAQRERATARNEGIRQARGEFIAFLDDDDLWLPAHLERALTAFERTQVGVVYSGWRHIDVKDRVLPEAPHLPTNRGQVLLDLLFGCWFPTSAALIRHTSLERAGNFDPSLVPVEDWDLWIRTAMNGSEFDFAPEPLVLYRLHEENSTNRLEQVEVRSAALLTKSFERLDGMYHEQRAEVFARLDFRSALKLLGSGQVEPACQRFARGVRAFPPLLNEPSTYYQVICAMQPDGYKGTQQLLDLKLGREFIEQALATLFVSDSTMRTYRARSLGDAYLTLAKLHYGRREMSEARRYLKLAVQANPRLLARTKLALALSKTFVPTRTLDFIKAQRGSLSQP